MSNYYPDDFIMSPKVDFAFKEIMTNAKVRKGFLSAVLDIPAEKIKKTVLKNTNLPKIHEDEKQGILDVYLTLNDDTEIDIEIQLSYMKAWADRSTFYLAKMLSEQVNINKGYTNFKKCIGINILDFNYLKDTDEFHSVYHIAEDKRHTIYTDIMEWHIVELLKLPAADDGTDLYDWISFIKAERKEEFEMLAKKNEFLDEAFKQLEVISQDEKMRMAYTARQKAVMDNNTLMEENFERGLAKGRAEERDIIISKLLKSGISLNEINKILAD